MLVRQVLRPAGNKNVRNDACNWRPIFGKPLEELRDVTTHVHSSFRPHGKVDGPPRRAHLDSWHGRTLQTYIEFEIAGKFMALKDAFVMNLGSNESDNKILGGQFLAELHHGRCMALGRVRDSEGMGDGLGSCHDGRA